jgi:hypothetical protein
LSSWSSLWIRPAICTIVLHCQKLSFLLYYVVKQDETPARIFRELFQNVHAELWAGEGESVVSPMVKHARKLVGYAAEMYDIYMSLAPGEPVRDFLRQAYLTQRSAYAVEVDVRAVSARTGLSKPGLPVATASPGRRERMGAWPSPPPKPPPACCCW